MSTPIPGPAGWPLLGNVNDIDPDVPIKSLMDIADKYGHYFIICQTIVTKADNKKVLFTVYRFSENVESWSPLLS